MWWKERKMYDARVYKGVEEKEESTRIKGKRKGEDWTLLFLLPRPSKKYSNNRKIFWAVPIKGEEDESCLFKEKNRKKRDNFQVFWKVTKKAPPPYYSLF